VIRIFWHHVVRDYIASRIHIFEVLLGVGDDVEDNRNLRMIWCERAQKCIAVACAASHLVVPALAMLVVTCDVTGVAGPFAVLLLPALLPVCAACVLPPPAVAWFFPAALLPVPLRIVCVLCPRRYVGCYLRCHLRGFCLFRVFLGFLGLC